MYVADNDDDDAEKSSGSSEDEPAAKKSKMPSVCYIIDYIWLRLWF